jgi:hypothetical protein
MKNVSKEIENANQHKEIKEYFKDFEDKFLNFGEGWVEAKQLPGQSGVWER